MWEPQKDLLGACVKCESTGGRWIWFIRDRHTWLALSMWVSAPPPLASPFPVSMVDPAGQPMTITSSVFALKDTQVSLSLLYIVLYCIEHHILYLWMTWIKKKKNTSHEVQNTCKGILKVVKWITVQYSIPYMFLSVLSKHIISKVKESLWNDYWTVLQVRGVRTVWIHVKASRVKLVPLASLFPLKDSSASVPQAVLALFVTRVRTWFIPLAVPMLYELVSVWLYCASAENIWNFNDRKFYLQMCFTVNWMQIIFKQWIGHYVRWSSQTLMVMHILSCQPWRTLVIPWCWSCGSSLALQMVSCSTMVRWGEEVTSLPSTFATAMWNFRTTSARDWPLLCELKTSDSCWPSPL